MLVAPVPITTIPNGWLNGVIRFVVDRPWWLNIFHGNCPACKEQLFRIRIKLRTLWTDVNGKTHIVDERWSPTRFLSYALWCKSCGYFEEESNMGGFPIHERLLRYLLVKDERC